MPTREVMRVFSKVSAARDILRNRAEELINEYIDIAKQAKASGDYESAYKALQWLIEHAPKDVDGNGIVDRSPDKEAPVKQVENSGPRIQIGIALGGIAQAQHALPSATVIEAEVKDEPVSTEPVPTNKPASVRKKVAK